MTLGVSLCEGVGPRIEGEPDKGMKLRNNAAERKEDATRSSRGSSIRKAAE